MRRFLLALALATVMGKSLALAGNYVTDFGVNDPDTKAAAKMEALKLSDGTRSYFYCPRNAAAITPSDTTDLTNPARSIYVGGGGDLTVNMAGTGTSIVFKAVPVGTLLQGQFARVKATGTTATNLVEFY